MAQQQLEKVSVIPQDEPRALAVVTPMDMIQKAVASGADIDMIEKLMGLQERYEASQARKAFDNAMSSAKAEIPIINKNRHVGFDSKKAGAARTDYKHEDLAEIARTVSPILGKYGLSYRFRTTSNVNEPVSVTCIVSHRDGHFEENTLFGGRDDSGNKNPLQAIGSTLTYLQRMTLKAALGLAAAHDDDGRTSSPAPEEIPAPPGSISQEQADNIRDLLEAKGASVAAFLNHAKLKRIEDMPAERYEGCVNSINGFKKS